MSDIKVTAIITVYNEKELVKRSIDSLLVQTLSEIEVLIIDDGSSDGTPEVIESIPDSRIRLIRGNRMGRAAALKLACEEAKGQYIANLDADDIAYPERLKMQAEFLDNNPDHAWVGCGEERRDTQRNEHIDRVYPLTDKEIRRQCAKCIPYTHSGITFRKSLIDEGINYDPQQPYLIDFEFFLRIAKKYKVANLPEVLACRYVRDESFFQSKFKTSKQNKRLARFGIQSVFWFRLPPWYLAYPLARLIYPMIPVGLKKVVRKANGLQESRS
ncbi:glycosyltransferase family 2 protein [Vibrio sp. 1288]|uniref:glycosyltransferase family 2 protein n=1 Tax=Vibrio sp. 1288 TaxID=3074550 RepID=UPI00296643A5|nr:glycosyltransferase family 2 protein [Vibrio sp. 1288]MDW3137691.1 glycosyltransferase family 2 protein [Vibrio sp. 1288]